MLTFNMSSVDGFSLTFSKSAEAVHRQATCPVVSLAVCMLVVPLVNLLFGLTFSDSSRRIDPGARPAVTRQQEGTIPTPCLVP